MIHTHTRGPILPPIAATVDRLAERFADVGPENS